MTQKKRRMWGEFDRDGGLTAVFPTRREAGWLIDGRWVSTFFGRYIRPVLVSWSTPPKRKRKAK